MLDVNYMQKSKGETSKFTFTCHREYEIYYFHAGKCTYLLGNRAYTLSPGDLIILDGTVLHRPIPHPDVEYCRTHVLFEPRVVDGFQMHPGMLNLLHPFESLRNSRLNIDDHRKRRIESILEQLARWDSMKSAVNKQRALLAFLELLVEIYEVCEHVEEQSPPRNIKEVMVEKVVETIENHYSQDISLDQIAESLHLSKFYISHTFKEITGLTIMDFIKNRRIREAKWLFVFEEDMTVTEMSYRLGFKHVAHFSRVFKDKVGVTPNQYRRKVRNQHCSEVDI